MPRRRVDELYSAHLDAEAERVTLNLQPAEKASLKILTDYMMAYIKALQEEKNSSGLRLLGSKVGSFLCEISHRRKPDRSVQLPSARCVARFHRSSSSDTWQYHVRPQRED